MIPLPPFDFRCFEKGVAFFLIALFPATVGGWQKEHGIQVPEGFRVDKICDDELATNIYALTVDQFGRTVVSGPGYVRILLDRNGDGVADDFLPFADGPKTGAQGMFFDGNDLICTGDQGLLRYRDADGNGISDGPPEVMLKMETGGEHTSHAIRRGPDGWLYVLAGNATTIRGEFFSGKRSPVKRPRSGFLMRISPDESTRQIVAHGFRNAYDFDFDEMGDVFVYDSDGERDISMPWYRPTRVFRMQLGADAGWISASWKRPGDYFDMPQVVAGLGRGSPTGVACYRHGQFPPEYVGALFVLDWTFGRVVAIKKSPDDRRQFEEKSERFAFATGHTGFAPTDIDVAPDGSLLISVGGRGTRGGVYRVTYERNSKSQVDPLLVQPHSSWSRKQFQERLASERKKFGGDAVKRKWEDRFLKVNQNRQRRNRIAEILTEYFDTSALLKRLPDDSSFRSSWHRLAWSLENRSWSAEDFQFLLECLRTGNEAARQSALQSLLTRNLAEIEQLTSENAEPFLEALARCIGDSKSPNTQRLWARLVGRLPERRYTELGGRLESPGERVAWVIGGSMANRQPAERLFSKARQLLVESVANHPSHASPASVHRDVLRAMQLALGDMRKEKNDKPVYSGYAAPQKFAGTDAELKQLAKSVAILIESPDRRVATEAIRLASLLRLPPPTLDSVALSCRDESDPVQVMHYLIALSRCGVSGEASRRAIVDSLLTIEAKIERAGVNRDRNWPIRFGEVLDQLAVQIPDLSKRFMERPEFGHLRHIELFRVLRGARRERAIERLAVSIETQLGTSSSDSPPIPSAAIRLISESRDRRSLAILRKLFDRRENRSLVVRALARHSDVQDVERFYWGLTSPDLETIRRSAVALRKLPGDVVHGRHLVAAIFTLRRLGWDKHDQSARQRLVELLRTKTGKRFGFEFGQTGLKPQQEVIDAWFRFGIATYPNASKRLTTDSNERQRRLRESIARLSSTPGDAKRGATLYRQWSCAKCHDGARAAGPSLAGVTKRFSHDDVLTAVIDPSRQVSSRYKTLKIQTMDGKLIKGVVVYESVDGITLIDSDGQTVRIEQESIDERKETADSLMPNDLLSDATAEDWRDLFEYLKKK